MRKESSSSFFFPYNNGTQASESQVVAGRGYLDETTFDETTLANRGVVLFHPCFLSGDVGVEVFARCTPSPLESRLLELEIFTRLVLRGGVVLLRPSARGTSLRHFQQNPARSVAGIC